MGLRVRPPCQALRFRRSPSVNTDAEINTSSAYMRSSSSRTDARLIHALATRLDALATEKSRAFWERYLKGVIPFRGVPMASNNPPELG